MGEEFEALGIPMQRRGALTNQGIAIMKELWTNPNPSYHSRRWSFDNVLFSPQCLQRPHIPLWIGGSSPGALKRAATLGDGWHPSGVSPEEYAIGRQEVMRLAEQAGRDPGALAWSARVEVEIGGGPSSARASGRSRVPGEDMAQLMGAISAYQSAGVEHLVLALNSGEVLRITETMELIAEKVVGEFR
jgi:alkanesulfonate monooxygenase SsuD/methylene tetrahydromethanopterin reductase-like flavin-dependent oxidoreductase (luciferase family)